MLRESNVGSAAAPSQCHGRSVSDGRTLCPGPPAWGHMCASGRQHGQSVRDGVTVCPGPAALAAPPRRYDVCALMRLSELVDTSGRVARASGRLEKVALLAALLRRSEPDEIEITVAFLCGNLRQAKLGVGFAGVRAAAPEGAAESPTLELSEVDATFERVAGVAGKGSVDEKLRLLRTLLAQATRDEQRFLVSLVVGELRQGALEGLVVEAVAQAAGVPAERVRRAVMAAGDLPSVAKVALLEGSDGLSRFSIRLFRPVLPMLADSADGARHALARLSPATRRMLEGLASEPPGKDKQAAVPLPDHRQLMPGTVLIREWHGIGHQVTIIEKGVLFRGKRYRSMSEVARLITGARWSGPRFFGVTA